MSKNFILAIGTLSGTIIGAGIFSLPYLFSKVGLITGLVYLAVFTIVYFFVHYMYAQILVEEKHEHQFFYYAKKYLPKFWSRIASFAILGELVLSLTVYLILAPAFGKLIFQNGNDFLIMMIFWFAGSAFILVKLSVLGWAELAGIFGVVGIIFLIFIQGSRADFLDQTPFFKNLDWMTFFLPFGPLLFSLAGRPAVPKVVEEWRKAKVAGKPFDLGKVIAWSMIVSFLVYAVFVIVVLKISPIVSEDTISNLFLPAPILRLIGAMGIIALWTSYFIIGINVKEILNIDLKVSKNISVSLAFFLPLTLYFLGFKNFLAAVGFTGGVFLGFEGIAVVWMWLKAFPKIKRREFVWPFFLIFALAIVYESYYFFSSTAQ